LLLLGSFLFLKTSCYRIFVLCFDPQTQLAEITAEVHGFCNRIGVQSDSPVQRMAAAFPQVTALISHGILSGASTGEAALSTQTGRNLSIHAPGLHNHDIVAFCVKVVDTNFGSTQMYVVFILY
jgi:hypothetical protein